MLELGQDTLAPELAYVTARYAARGSARRSCKRRSLPRPRASLRRQRQAFVVGLDSGYVRHRHRAERRRFEVIAGKVIQAHGSQHRFAFTRAGPILTKEVFQQASPRPLPAVCIVSVVNGFNAYHAVPTNGGALGVPRTRQNSLMSHAEAAQPAGQDDVGAAEHARRRVTPKNR